MPVSGCSEAMEVFNLVATTGLILNDGHEIFARLNAGDDLADIACDLGTKFGHPEMAGEVRRVVNGWPPLQREAIRQMVTWALSKLDTEDRITMRWKGDTESPETVTRFELREHDLYIEFAHPPSLFATAASPVTAQS